MLKIGIVGTDGGGKSGHTSGIVKLIESGNFDAKIEVIMGTNAIENEEVAQLCKNKPRIVSDMNEFLKYCDAVMIMHRNGNLHANYAIEALEAGKAVFVDKPLACSVEDAESIIEVAKKNKSVLHSGSYVGNAIELHEIKGKLKHSGEISSIYISFPLVNYPQYGGIHFYSHHILAEYCAVFEQEIQSVTAMSVNEQITVMADCGDFPALFNYSVGYGSLQFGVYFKDGTNLFKNIVSYSNTVQLQEFINAAKTGDVVVDFDKQLLPVRVSCAIDRSLKSGLSEKV